MTSRLDDPGDAERFRAARLDGVRLAVRTLDHQINNRLTTVVGFAEILANDPSLTPRHRQFAQHCLDQALAAADLLHRLTTISDVVEMAHDQPYGPLIDLDRSGS